MRGAGGPCHFAWRISSQRLNWQGKMLQNCGKGTLVSDEYDNENYGSVSTLDDVCDKLDEIERAIRDKGSTLGAIFALVVVWVVILGLSDLWQSKLRYAWWYNVSSDQVTIEKKPTDCDFFRAPLGDKECHYERRVSTVRVKTEYLDFQRGSVNYVSFDNGKTWNVDPANPPTKPKVMISWEKVEGE